MAQELYNKNNNISLSRRIANNEKSLLLIEAHALCENAIKNFPNSFGAINCKSLLNVIEEKDLKINLEKINIANQPFRGYLRHKNLDNLYIKLIRIDSETYSSWKRKNNDKTLLEKLVKQTQVKSWNVSVKNEKDYQFHSTEFKVEKLPFGHYVLIAGDSPDFSNSNHGVSFTPFWVSNLSYLHRSMPKGGSEVIVYDRESGLPLQDVNVQLFTNNYNRSTRKYETKKLSTFITDENGSFKINLSNDFRNYYLKLKYQNDYLNIGDRHYSYRNYGNEFTRVKTMIFTDRAIYRPGQTVYFKGIVLETNGKQHNIKPKHTITVIFKDVNYQKISEIELTSNEYGSISGSFITPSTGLNGQMRIECEGGTHYISVEEYKRPKFAVKFDPIEGSYKLGEQVTVKGNAQMFSGAAVDGAEVVYRVVRQANFPRWCYYRYGYSPWSKSVEVSRGKVTTDENGEFTIDFKAIADQSVESKLSPTYSFTVNVDVIDISGETHSSTTNVYVSYKALILSIDIPDQLNKSSNELINISSTNLNGEYEPSSGTVKIWSLNIPDQYYRSRLWDISDQHLITKDDYSIDFPFDIYNDENNRYKWKKNTKVYDHPFETEKQKTLVLENLNEWQPGFYKMEATTTDKFGQDITDIRYFQLYDEKENHPSMNEMLQIIPIINKCEPGEHAKYLISSACKNVIISYEIEHQNKIIHQKWLKLNEQQQLISIAIDFPRDCLIYCILPLLLNRIRLLLPILYPNQFKEG